LTLELGPAAVVQTAHRLGIASKLDPNPSIALGTSEVSLLELVSAYAPFANGGIAVLPHIVERVRSAEGKTLYRHDKRSLGRVVDDPYIAMMNMMLQETLLTGTARRAALPGWPAAGKTGTSQDFRDAWFVGYTAHLVTGVWLGNDDNSPTRKTTGGGLPVEIWSRFMKAAHQGAVVAHLPGTRASSFTGSLPTGLSPPAEVGTPIPASADRSQAPESVSLDRWLMEKLFGRR
jgi:penicillin-binding protein 1A